MGAGAIHADAHTSGLSALLLSLPRLRHADAECAACRIQPSRDDRRSGQQPGTRGGRLRDMSDHLLRGNHIQQEAPFQSKRLRQRIIVLQRVLVKVVIAVALGQILRDHARQSVGNKAVALQEGPRPADKLRLMLHEIEDFRQRIRRRKRVSGGLEDPLRADPCLIAGADLLCARIHPDGRSAQHISLRVNRNGRPALPVDPDGRDLFRADTGLRQQLTAPAANRVPPGIRVLLHAAGGRRIERRAACNAARRCAVLPEQRQLAGRGSNVDRQKEHDMPPI